MTRRTLTLRWPWFAPLALTLAACSPAKQDAPAPAATTAAAPAQTSTPSDNTTDTTPAEAPPAGMEHGDHLAHHGGLVLMENDIHFEVLAGRAGKYEIYFSDPMRKDLPAAKASNATITVLRDKAEPEVIPLKIDEKKQGWVGEGRPVDDPATTIHIAYTRAGQSKEYWIDVPLVAWELAMGEKKP